MAKKVLCFVGHLPEKEMQGFLDLKKNTYLNQGQDLCVNVVSSQENNHGQIAEKVKQKKPHYLIFDGVPKETAYAIEKAVLKRCPNNPPAIKTETDFKNHLELS